jgi:hypothetical protein
VYLFAALCLAACFTVAWLLAPGLRRSSLLAAVSLAPFALLGAAFVPAYWQPDHRFTFVRGVGVEDVLFCFACGGVCWVVAAAGGGVKVEGAVEVGRFVARFAGWAVVALVGVVAAWWLGCDILPAVIAGFTIGGLAALCNTPRAARLILPGTVGFTAVYAGVGWLVLGVYPGCAGFWACDAICGRRVLSLPVEELVWALSFGATWPVVFAYCLGDGLTWRARGDDGG